MSKIIAIALTILISTNIGCGTKNLGDSDSNLTPEQQAKRHMNNGEYQLAIDILAPLVEENPLEYGRMPLLSAAYASMAGVDILSLVIGSGSGSDSSESSAGDTIFSKMSAFLPDDYDRDDVDLMGAAVSTLELIPIELRGVEGDPDYGDSADFQTTLYRSLYSSMYLALFVGFDINGDIDLDQLSQLSEEDAAAILAALRAATLESNSQAGAAISGSISSTLNKIDDAEGETDAERLSNFVAN